MKGLRSRLVCVAVPDKVLVCHCISEAVSVLWREEGYTMKYSLSPREIPRPKAEGFPEGSGYISLSFLTLVAIQTFSITNPALTCLGDQYWKSWFSVWLWQLGNTGKYCPVDWGHFQCVDTVVCYNTLCSMFKRRKNISEFKFLLQSSFSGFWQLVYLPG